MQRSWNKQRSRAGFSYPMTARTMLNHFRSRLVAPIGPVVESIIVLWSVSDPAELRARARSEAYTTNLILMHAPHHDTVAGHVHNIFRTRQRHGLARPKILRVGRRRQPQVR